MQEDIGLFWASGFFIIIITAGDFTQSHKLHLYTNIYSWVNNSDI